MVEPLPIGVLGLGRMGQVHARHLADLPGARLVAAASRRPKMAQEMNRFPSPDGEDDRAALEIASAATQSLKSGRPVKLSGRQR